MQFKGFAAGAALVLAQGAALAADLPSRTEPPRPILEPAPARDWRGFYAGSIFGGGTSSFRSNQAAARSVSNWGQTGGALVGYNFQTDKFVYGLEGDIDLHLIRAGNQGVAGGLIAHNLDTLYTTHLRGRLGYDFGPVMPYVAGGVAINEDYMSNAAPAPQFGQNRTMTGFTLGAGLDWKLVVPVVGPTTVRLEYLYDSLPATSYAMAGGPVRVQTRSQFIRAALIYRPGDDWKAPVNEMDPALWAGAYGGFIGGGMWASARTSLGAASTSSNASGPLGGVYMGQNWMFGSWMLGIDGVTALAAVNGNGAMPGAPSTYIRNYVQADLRGRAGYALGRFLPFIAAGAAWGRSEQRDTITGSQRGRIPSDAWTIGAGLDYMFAERWSLRAEYLYEATYKIQTTGIDGQPFAQSRKASSVRLGVAWHFH